MPANIHTPTGLLSATHPSSGLLRISLPLPQPTGRFRRLPGFLPGPTHSAHLTQPSRSADLTDRDWTAYHTTIKQQPTKPHCNKTYETAL